MFLLRTWPTSARAPPLTGRKYPVLWTRRGRRMDQAGPCPCPGKGRAHSLLRWGARAPRPLLLPPAVVGLRGDLLSLEHPCREAPAAHSGGVGVFSTPWLGDAPGAEMLVPPFLGASPSHGMRWLQAGTRCHGVRGCRTRGLLLVPAPLLCIKGEAAGRGRAGGASS